jgi:hypothetical protein
MKNSEVDDFLRKILLEYVEFKVLMEKSLGLCAKPGTALSEFLFASNEGIILRENLAGHLFDRFMVTHKPYELKTKIVALDFHDTQKAKKVFWLLNVDDLGKFIKSEFFVNFRIERQSGKVLIKLD